MMLPDPRLMPRVAPKNELIRAVMSLLTEPDGAEAERKRGELRRLTAEKLEFDDNQSLSVALQLAPDQTAFRTLWHSLVDTLASPSTARHAVVFAVPVVLAAGSKTATTLPAQVDAAPLLAILRQHGVVRADAEVSLSGHLLHADTLASVAFSQWFRFGSFLTDAARGVPLDLAGSDVPVHEEGVFVRYLLGVAMQNPDEAPAIRLGGSMGEWGMPFMQQLNEQMKTPGVTLFPIPAVPNVVPEALRQGAALRLDVNMQMWASNIIRKLRAGNAGIAGVAAAHENGELRFTVSSPGDDKNWAAFVWPLAPLDAVERIEENFRALMAECQVEDVRVVGTIQPDRIDEVPVFLTCNDAITLTPPENLH